MIHILKNNKLYTSKDKKLIKKIKNCYIIINSGTSINPCITYYKRENGKNLEVIFLGGIRELINFLLENRENNTFLITGFSRAGIASIYKTYLETGMCSLREQIRSNENKIKKLTNKTNNEK